MGLEGDLGSALERLVEQHYSDKLIKFFSGNNGEKRPKRVNREMGAQRPHRLGEFDDDESQSDAHRPNHRTKFIASFRRHPAHVPAHFFILEIVFSGDVATDGADHYVDD